MKLREIQKHVERAQEVFEVANLIGAVWQCFDICPNAAQEFMNYIDGL